MRFGFLLSGYLPCVQQLIRWVVSNSLNVQRVGQFLAVVRVQFGTLHYFTFQQRTEAWNTQHAQCLSNFRHYYYQRRECCACPAANTHTTQYQITCLCLLIEICGVFFFAERILIQAIFKLTYGNVCV